MAEFCALIEGDRSLSVCLFIEQPEILAIGEKMEQLCPEAMMNGYNWEAFLQAYLEQKAPALLEGMGHDPEAGMYAAYYPNSPENLEKAKELLELLRDLIQRPEQIYQFLEESGDLIAWD